MQVAFVTATNNYRKELQFRSLRQDANDMVRIRCIRNGTEVPVPVAEVVVGDVVHLETGDKVRELEGRHSTAQAPAVWSVSFPPPRDSAFLSC